MKKTPLILSLLSLMFLPALATADVIVSDDFSSYGANTVIGGPNWNVKWDGNDPTQQNLFVTDASGGVCIDTTVANANYHAVNQVGFSLTGTDTATVSTDFTYTHNGLGDPTNLNERFFGMVFTDQPQWWNGTNAVVDVVNRGNAIGNRLPVAPWVENWQTHAGFNVDKNSGSANTSDVIALTVDLSVNGAGNYEAVYTYGAATSLAIDLGFASGTTIYSGYSTAWNNVGTVEDATNISKIGMDNFQIEVFSAVPEPSSAGLIVLATMVGFVARRRK